MTEDAGAAQARALLLEMQQQVADLSQRIEKTERRKGVRSLRGATHERRTQSALRRELYEAHRLIDGLHVRYPETLTRRPVSDSAQR